MFAEKRESFPNMLQLRMRRAISWIDRAERSDNDDDSKFIFYWISLNAAYSTDQIQDGTSEMALLDAFLDQIVELDEEQELYGLVSDEFQIYSCFLTMSTYSSRSGMVETGKICSKMKT